MSSVPSRLTRGALLVAAASLLVLAGCRSGPAACARPGLYAQARSVDALRIPAGLDAIDTRGSLRIPELNEPEAPRPAGVNCLEEPPRYSATARLEPPPKGRDEAKQGEGAKAPPPAQPAPAAPPRP